MAPGDLGHGGPGFDPSPCRDLTKTTLLQKTELTGISMNLTSTALVTISRICPTKRGCSGRERHGLSTIQKWRHRGMARIVKANGFMNMASHSPVNDCKICPGFQSDSARGLPRLLLGPLCQVFLLPFSYLSCQILIHHHFRSNSTCNIVDLQIPKETQHPKGIFYL